MGPLNGRSRTVLVTGGNRGIGLEAARVLVGEGHRVLLGSRNPGAGERALADILGGGPAGRAEVVPGDLSTREGVERLAKEVMRRTDRLEVLVNNAAVVSHERLLTADGTELQFAVNHLAPFHLTRLLLPLLLDSAPARVVTVASRAHRRGRIPWDDLQGEKRYGPRSTYAFTKLANVLFTAELAKRLEGKGVSAVSLHPGVYGTGLLQALGGPVGALLRRVLSTPVAGGRMVARLALDPDLSGSNGVYFDRTLPATPSRRARDAAQARRLWEVSEVLTTRDSK